MATMSCSSEDEYLRLPPVDSGDSTQDSPQSGLGDESVSSIDLIQGIIECRQKLTKSLFVEQISEVSFSKEGHRFYRVQWESTWESEDDLLNACKDILRTYWDNHIQFNIILDKAGYPKEPDNEIKKDEDAIEETNILEDHAIESPLPTQVEPVEPIFSLLDTSEKTSSEDEPKLKDILEQYKNVGFAKSVRENFGRELPSDNKFDFVENYLAQKLVVKSRNAMRKKARDETVKEYISYKNGTRVYCDICSESFADAKSLKNHKVCRHDLYSPHQCNICLKMFMKPGDVRRHMASHSPTRAYYCYFCEKTYKTKNHLHRHIKAKHPNLTVTDNDILEQMLGANDTDPNDLNQSVINITQDDTSNILTTETLNNSFNATNTLNSLGPFTANTVFANTFQDTLKNGGVVLQQPDLSETFLNPAAAGIPMCLIDKSDSFFNCPSFTSVNTLLQT